MQAREAPIACSGFVFPDRVKDFGRVPCQHTSSATLSFLLACLAEL
jgi:hypothetical protein